MRTPMSRIRAARSPNSAASDVRAAEQLDQGGAGRGEPLDHLDVHAGVQLGRLAAQVGDGAAHPPGRQHEDRQQQQREQRDLPGQADHHGQRQQQLDAVAQHRGQRGGDRRLGAEHVVVQPADQRAGAGAGEERDRHPLHVLEDRPAQVDDQPLADARGEPARRPARPRPPARPARRSPAASPSTVPAAADTSPPATMAFTTRPASTGVSTPMVADHHGEQQERQQPAGGRAG